MQELIKNVYDHIENDHVANAVRACLRLARLRNDHLSSVIFTKELFPDVEQIHDSHKIITENLNEAISKELLVIGTGKWIKERTIDSKKDFLSGMVYALGVGELETDEKRNNEMLAELKEQLGVEGYCDDKTYSFIAELREKGRVLSCIRERIKTRCVNYAIQCEIQLKNQQGSENFIVVIQSDVNNFFKERSQDVFSKLQKISELVTSNDEEDFSLLSTEVRRTIKSVADFFHPAETGQVVCIDGKHRNMGDDAFLNRLEEYIRKNYSQGTSGELLTKEVELLIALVRKLNDLTSKGVHSNVLLDEARRINSFYHLVAML